VLGIDGLGAAKEGVDGARLGSWDAAGGDPLGGNAMGCSGVNGRSGRSGRSGNEISSPIEGYQSSP
jgi:hypothetical protein